VFHPITPSPDARHVAYIRRSVVSRSAPGDLSRDYQTDEVRKLAGDDADRLVILDGDWGRSGSRHEAETRTVFRELLASIERGEVSGLFAYSCDRLARDVEAAARLLNICERAGVKIVTREGTYPPGDRAARASFNLAALMNEDYSSQASEKQSAVSARRVARGDLMGPPPYGMRLAPRTKGEPISWERDPERDPADVLAAYQEAGSFNGAARLLNERNVPGPRGGRWYSGSVGRILHAQRGDVFEVRHTERRVKHGGSAAIFRRLLVCHCGGHPTPTRQRDGSFVYRCNAGYAEPITGFGARRRSIRPGHPDGITVSEKVVQAWAEVESAKWDRYVAVMRSAPVETIDQGTLVARRKRAGLAFTMGALTQTELAVELSEIDRLLDRAEARPSDQVKGFAFRKGVDWTADPQAIASAVRRLWSAIQLGPDMRPVRADWRFHIPTDEEVEAADAIAAAIAEERAS